MDVKKALTIAGSDSGGGAGIQADLKTFAALGVHGMSVITSITAQNTYEVRAVHDIPLNVIKSQFEAVIEDIGVDAAKTGMLSNSDIIELVADLVKKYNVTLVVDPVMVAKSGAPLLREDAVNTLINKLIPLATVITPNKPEAEKLSGKSIKELSDARVVAKQLVDDLGAMAAVIKGGHMSDEDSVDIMYYDGKYYEFRAPRLESRSTHGTGCSFSAAITAELAKGKSIPEAVKIAKEFITTAIMYGLPVGKGHGPVNPTAWQLIPAEKYKTLQQLNEAVKLIENSSKYVINLIPESQSEIVMALPKFYVRSINDVAGVPGKLNKVKDRIKAASPPEFGLKSALSELLIKIMERYDEVRSASSIAYNELLDKVIRELGLNVSYLESVEGLISDSSKALLHGKGVKESAPDVLIDKGSWGKEPRIIVLGINALDVANKIIKIGSRYVEHLSSIKK
ncbi:MAG: bifunctional hydroxymethylpyrimidine kinase/phosphomethylpyrimidine kinase [Sulfolobales archaeon]|nr:bifunctional hydroxymethylpyrimidine kinase/phosphomethylpyrimidine kinase [Sulfolobales archaeon]MCX8186091.1 bifunctional hydroxymethylpyrimidine kinase/phosphomethylpyrimidine kinase [Sulfolobales archaeon]MDW7969386.1 bifunctional hydroxymethylpyrimidine kinase/phosphomethylpyrimidine kinase [Sulfolobales archaeon]